MVDGFPTYDAKGKLHYENRRQPQEKPMNAFALGVLLLWVFACGFLIIYFIFN